MFRKSFLTFVTCAFAAFAAGQTLAQSDLPPQMTEEQILEAFSKQKTRGLAIAPAADSTAPTEAAAEATTSVSTAQTSLNTVPKEDAVFVNISFDFDSAALRNDQLPKLSALCNAMQVADVETFRILGHTDSSGTAEYNKRLSLLRAEEVKRHLVSQCGLASERLIAVGVGEEFPYDEGNPEADVNRRVEFQVIS